MFFSLCLSNVNILLCTLKFLSNKKGWVRYLAQLYADLFAVTSDESLSSEIFVFPAPCLFQSVSIYLLERSRMLFYACNQICSGSVNKIKQARDDVLSKASIGKLIGDEILIVLD